MGYRTVNRDQTWLRVAPLARAERCEPRCAHCARSSQALAWLDLETVITAPGPGPARHSHTAPRAAHAFRRAPSSAPCLPAPCTARQHGPAPRLCPPSAAPPSHLAVCASEDAYAVTRRAVAVPPARPSRVKHTCEAVKRQATCAALTRQAHVRCQCTAFPTCHVSEQPAFPTVPRPPPAAHPS